MRRTTAVLVSVAVVIAACALPGLPRATAIEVRVDCADDATCDFPTPEECTDTGPSGVWDGGPPGRGAVCAGAAGHSIVYAGGEPTAACGAVVVADVNVVEGPTVGRGGDPSACPYGPWPTEVHDPAVAVSRNAYYLFGTGPGIPIWISHDLRRWTPAGKVFASGLPSWAKQAIPGAIDPWAPDVSFFNGRWHVYYAVSTFGAKRSAIGVATNPVLDPHDPRYLWTDHGVVVESSDTTDYNAIDPNVVIGPDGRPRLVFGSFWSGIKTAPIDPPTGKLAGSLSQLASRLVPTWGIEAPFVVRRGGFFYLFVSFDYCCRGSASTYNIRVGRSTSVDGPFVDDRGVPMLLGGGRLVLEGQGSRRGPGHNAIVKEGEDWRVFFHYYDAGRSGTASLGILPLRWTTDGWPVVDWADLGRVSVGTS
jgi:arabinan endo-1,5-alpha-L-arabinosidase